MNFAELKESLNKINSSKSLNEVAEILNLSREELELEFKNFQQTLSVLFEKEPLRENIIAINFGLFEDNKGNVCYISGSKEYNKENFDWASSNDYFPENRYFNIPIILNASIEDSIIIIYSFARYLDTNLINSNIIITVGYDDGDLYEVQRFIK